MPERAWRRLQPDSAQATVLSRHQALLLHVQYLRELRDAGGKEGAVGDLRLRGAGIVRWQIGFSEKAAGRSHVGNAGEFRYRRS